jgi:hypothetical protein
LPFLIGTADPAAAQAEYDKAFPPVSRVSGAVRHLLAALLTRDGADLYDASSLPEAAHRERYGFPPACVTVKLGLALRRLCDASDPETDVALLERWRSVLLDVLRERQGDHVGRGFAPDWPEFENLVLALRDVGEWYAQPDVWRAPEFVRSYAGNPAEALTADQAALCGALYGRLRGYRGIAGYVADRSLRRRLSGLAMALVVRRLGLGGPSGGATERLARLYATDGRPEEWRSGASSR